MAEYMNKEFFLSSMGLTGDETKYGNRDAEHQHRSYSTYMSYEIIDSVEDSIVEEELAPVQHGKWEWFEEWIPSTTEHPKECEDCGWRCGNCMWELEDMVGLYWDDPDERPQLAYCPNCGAKMDLEG